MTAKRAWKSPSGSQSENTISVPNLGVTVLGSKERGNLVVHILVNIPTKLSDEERKLIEEFEELHDGKDDVIVQRAIPDSTTNHKGFFSKLKDAFC